MLVYNITATGFAKPIACNSSSTAAELFQMLNLGDPADYTIEVNGDVCEDPSVPLAEYSRVRFIPIAPVAEAARNNVNVMLVNPNAGGRVERLSLAPETTVSDIFDRYVGGDIGSFIIRVNGSPASPADYVQDGIRVTVSPKKIEGAR